MGAPKTKTISWHFILHGEGFGRVTKLVQQTDNAGLSFCTLLALGFFFFSVLVFIRNYFIKIVRLLQNKVRICFL